MDILKRWGKYIVVTVTGVMLTVLICCLKEFSFTMGSQKNFKILSDATFFTAVLLIGFGAMISLSNFGIFTSVTYTMKRFIAVLSKNSIKKRKYIPNYHEYRAVKLENKISGAFIYIPGLIFMVISIIFTMMYY